MKRLMAYIGKYKKYAIATPFVMIGEVLMELLIPLVMAAMIDKGISSGDVQYTVKMGLLMILMAIVSLCFGSLGARFGALASMGFAKNLFDAVSVAVTAVIGFAAAGRLVGIGAGTVCAMLGTGRAIALCNHLFGARLERVRAAAPISWLGEGAADGVDITPPAR